MSARTLLAAFATFVAAPALAGCDDFATAPRDSYREIAARPGSYVMALGHFSEGPVVDEIYALALDGSETSTRIVAASFQGQTAASDGFTAGFDSRVEVAQRCDSTGCRPRLDGTRYLVFLEKARGRYVFAEDGCAARAYENPADSDLRAVISCLNGVCP